MAGSSSGFGNQFSVSKHLGYGSGIKDNGVWRWLDGFDGRLSAVEVGLAFKSV